MLDGGWAAASTAFSACFYLLDLGTTISTLVAYYRYEYYCPHAPLPSSLLLRDPICRAIRTGHGIQPVAFSGSLFVLAMAYLTYPFMFWISLDRRKHPLRLAYFMPLIHFYRLFKLLCHSLSSNGLKELQNSQVESSSLYSALGASLETVPQFIHQFRILLKLRQFLKASSDPSTQIPTNLMLSLVASMLSGVYNASMAVWFLMRKQQYVSWARRACFSTTAGCQAFIIMLAKAMFVAALSELSEIYLISVVIYILLGVIMAWSFNGFLMRSHCDSQGKSKFLIAVHSLGFALMTTSIGPIYVVVKLGESARHWIWGTLLHIFVELIGLTLVFSLPSVFRKLNSPCHFSSIQEESKYMTCKVFLGTILPSLFVMLLTSIFCAWVHVKSGKDARDGSRAPRDIVCSIQPLETFEEITSQQRSMYNFKTLLLLIELTILFVLKLQKKYIL